MNNLNKINQLILVVFLLLMNTTANAADKKVVVLGIDGLDPKLLQHYMDQGLLPNFSKVISSGDFKPLQTTMAPQSPIAWSTFISGMDPGGHSIFDFVHRNLQLNPPMPMPSMSQAADPPKSVTIGAWVIPLGSGEVKNMRQGKAFWQVLGEEGIPSIIYKMPVNFPPVKHPGYSLSGMGTPDLKGTSGTFSYFTTRLPSNAGSFTGGDAYRVRINDNVIKEKLMGPPNTFRTEERRRVQKGRRIEYVAAKPDLEIEFTVHLDVQANAAYFKIGNNEFVLKEGERSGWISFDLEAVPYLVSVSATAWFYLKEIEPDFKLYVSPLQINPANPAMPISHPAGWSKELCDCLGFFYTQELPEDTKALTYNVFTGKEFWEQTMLIYDENMRGLKYTLDMHEEGLLFYYFGTIDQGCHMLWRYMDQNHPGYVQDDFLQNGIQKLYQSLDESVKVVLDSIDDDTTLIIMSDHGFSPFYWGVNLNTWLLENGFAAVISPAQRGNMTTWFANIDWKKTKAYAVGLNGLYINLEGREKSGCVPQDEYDALLDELKEKLLALKDPKTGQNVITKVTIPSREFHGPYKSDGPDIIVGYNYGYRSSWENPLGGYPEEIIVDNNNAWSGDHCIDNSHVPGCLISNKKITLDHPALYDLTVAVLDEFGVSPLQEMIGQDCLGDFVEAAKQTAQAE